MALRFIDADGHGGTVSDAVRARLAAFSSQLFGSGWSMPCPLTCRFLPAATELSQWRDSVGFGRLGWPGYLHGAQDCH